MVLERIKVIVFREIGSDVLERIYRSMEEYRLKGSLVKKNVFYMKVLLL